MKSNFTATQTTSLTSI